MYHTYVPNTAFEVAALSLKMVEEVRIELTPCLADYGFTVRSNLSQYLPLFRENGSRGWSRTNTFFRI
jgi:hypothetical protein